MYRKVIENYIPVNEQEEMDKKAMLEFIKRNDDALSRENLIAHLTTSSIIVNHDYTKILFAYHLIYQSWAWLGGHNDDDPDCLRVAIKEANEESGLENVKAVSEEPIMLDIIQVKNHIKKGKYVPDHLHLNLTYLLIADDKERLVIKEDENSGVKWFNIDEVLKYVNEERMLPIYIKAINKIKEFKKKKNR